MSAVKLNWELSVGHIATVASFFFAGATLYSGFNSRVDVLDNRVSAITSNLEKIEGTLDKLVAIVAADARQEEKIVAIMVRLDRIERILDTQAKRSQLPGLGSP